MQHYFVDNNLIRWLLRIGQFSNFAVLFFSLLHRIHKAVMALLFQILSNLMLNVQYRIYSSIMRKILY